MKPTMAFGDIVRKGNSRSPNLAAQLKFFKRRQSPIHSIHCHAKFPRDLINLQIFKCPISFWFFLALSLPVVSSAVLIHPFNASTLHRFNDSLQSLASNNPAFPGAVPAEPPSSRPPLFEQPCLLWQSVPLFPDNLHGIARRGFLFFP